MCAQPNNFAQPTVRKGSQAPESIKNERIGESDSGGSLLQCNRKSPSNGRETSLTRKIFARSALQQPEFQKNFATQTDALQAHSPSLRFNTSLTACGLALPPDAFITWPTNHPIAFGLVLASPTLSGFIAIISSTSFSSAETSVTCFNPRVSTRVRGSPPSFQTISNTALAILLEIVPSAMRLGMAPSCASFTGEVAISLPSRLSRPA